MRQLSTGATAAAVASPVGFIADKRLMGGKTFDAFVAGQPELGSMTAGDWTATGGGSVAQSGGDLLFTAGGSANTGGSYALSCVVGEVYRIQGTIALGTASVVDAQVSASLSGGVSIATIDGGSTYIFTNTATNTFSRYFRATATTHYFQVSPRTAGLTCTLSGLTIKAIPGNHATQATAAARPILGREPVGGRRNLLTYSNDFSNAAWGSNLSALAQDVSGPLGENVWTLTDNSDVSALRIVQTRSGIAANSTLTLSFLLGKDSVLTTTPIITISFTAGTAQNYRIQIDPTTGAVNEQVESAVGTTTVTSYDADFWRVVMTATDSGSNTTVSCEITPAGNNAYPRAGINSAATGSAVVGYCQLETGSTATDYQKVVSQYDVTEAGVSDVYYLAFDGVDDSLATASIDFSATDSVSVFGGVRKLSDAAIGVILGLSANPGASTGVFEALGPVNAATDNYRWTTKGTVSVSLTPTGFAAPITNVLTGIGDIAADTATLRANGVQVATSAGDQGTGNYGNYPLYIGRRGGSSLPFNGRIYSLIVRGLLTSGDDLTNAETYVADKTGVNI
jgi:hypothetical protein